MKTIEYLKQLAVFLYSEQREVEKEIKAITKEKEQAQAQLTPVPLHKVAAQ